MSSSSRVDRICLGIFTATIILTLLFMQGLSSGWIAAADSSASVSYANRLFDTSYVHRIDLVIDDADAFFEDAMSESYVPAKIVIDGESFGTVALRTKGNTSLTNVKEYGNNRYSLKVEFDHYDSANTYYGLDKLNLNNLIQDNTLMKDYLIYRMMRDAGADSPLASYASLSINGEVFGLYLAVEGVEDGFMDRLGLAGNLYKPDSQSMNAGGEMGEGMPDGGNSPDADAGGGMTRSKGGAANPDGSSDASADSSAGSGTGAPAMPGMPNGDDRPADMNGPGQPGQSADAQAGQGTDGQSGATPPSDPSGGQNGSGQDSPASDGNFPDFSNSAPGSAPGGQESDRQMQGGGNGGMNSADLKLQYIDDNIDSYANIFDQAKTEVSTADQRRLIESLKKLSEQEDLEEILDIDTLIPYFAVHVFSENADSYTGQMIHNYYLYEDGGKLSMIPWDYNLAFGGFQSSSATDTVNAPIDSPVDDMSDRPMIAWIFGSETYLDAYHEALSELSDKILDGTYTDEVTRVYEMILPYVEDDPTCFVTVDEFKTGVETLREFLVLRARSIAGQIDGTIPSTASGQTADPSSLIDASSITISDMGSMKTATMDKGGQNTDLPAGTAPESPSESPGGSQLPDQSTSGQSPQMPNAPQMPAGGSAQDNLKEQWTGASSV